MAFENNVQTTLHANLAIGATTMEVAKSAAPNNDVPESGKLTLTGTDKVEIISYAGRTDATTHWTLTGVTKNAESNFGDQAWSAGDTVYQALTAGDVQELRDNAGTGTVSYALFEYTVASNGQVDFTGVDINGNTLEYTPDSLTVIRQGFTLPSSDYTATDGTTVSISAGTLQAGESVIIQAFGVAGGGTTVYDTLVELPLADNDQGAMAYVAENNRLYLWTGAGWFNIALINSSPTITSGADASYALATDGTPTVITLAAEDPEGLNITWSHQITTGSLGSTATITQADNVFTITPSIVEGDAGAFGVTFTASDGVNIATSVSSFSLAFSLFASVSGTLSSATLVRTVNFNGYNGSSWKNLSFSSDGQHMYAAHNDYMYSFELSTPWDISTASSTVGYPSSSNYFNNQYPTLHGWTLDNDGSHVIGVSVSGSSLTFHKKALTTPWNITTSTSAGETNAPLGYIWESATHFILLSEDGTWLARADSTGTAMVVHQTTNGNPNNTYTNPDMTRYKYFGVQCVCTNAKGTDVFTIDGQEIHHYTMTTPFSFNIVAHQSSFLKPDSGTYVAVAISANGQYLYALNGTNGNVHQLEIL